MDCRPNQGRGGGDSQSEVVDKISLFLRLAAQDTVRHGAEVRVMSCIFEQHLSYPPALTGTTYLRLVPM